MTSKTGIKRPLGQLKSHHFDFQLGRIDTMKFLVLTFVALAAAQNCPPAPPPLECGPEELMCPGKPMGPEGCMGPGSCQHQSKDANGMTKAKINMQMYKKYF